MGLTQEIKSKLDTEFFEGMLEYNDSTSNFPISNPIYYVIFPEYFSLIKIMSDVNCTICTQLCTKKYIC